MINTENPCGKRISAAPYWMSPVNTFKDLILKVNHLGYMILRLKPRRQSSSARLPHLGSCLK